MRTSTLVILGGLTFAASSAQAQGACADIAKFFEKPPELGKWAELTAVVKKGQKPSLMRVAFVGKEQLNGKPAYRMQMVMADGKGQRQIFQMVTPWTLEALSSEGDAEVVMKMGNNPAMKMTVDDKTANPGMSDIRKKCADIKYLGEESVEVPAGTFKARHYQGPDGDTWASEDVPGWKLVKMITKDGHSMMLTAMGSGAKNEITETPVDMKAMMGNPEGLRKMMEGKKQPDDK